MSPRHRAGPPVPLAVLVPNVTIAKGAGPFTCDGAGIEEGSVQLP